MSELSAALQNAAATTGRETRKALESVNERLDQIIALLKQIAEARGDASADEAKLLTDDE